MFTGFVRGLGVRLRLADVKGAAANRFLRAAQTDSALAGPLWLISFTTCSWLSCLNVVAH